jgi:activating signal cointegrator 1
MRDATRDLVRGFVIGHVDVVECLPTDNYEVDGREKCFGDYSPGRFAWVLCDPVAYEKPMPCRGRQKIFDVSPEELGLR